MQNKNKTKYIFNHNQHEKIYSLCSKTNFQPEFQKEKVYKISLLENGITQVKNCYGKDNSVFQVQETKSTKAPHPLKIVN